MKKICLALGVLIFLTPVIVGAAQFQSGNSYALGNTEQINTDLYAAGGSVSLQGVVNGDAVLAGGMVSVTGDTAQDVLAAGGNLMLTGRVGDDIRAAGGNVTVGGMVVGDVVLAGGQITLLPDTRVGGDALVTGGSIVLNGSIQGKAIIRGGNVTIGGQISGPVTIEAQKVTFTRTAVLTGTLTYRSPEQAEIESGAQVPSNSTYIPIEQRGGAQNYVASTIIKFLVLFISALVLGLLLKRFAYRVSEQAHTEFWWNVLRGFLFMIATPVAIVIMLITVVGIPIAVIVLLTYIIMLMLAYIFSVIVAGSLLNKWLFKRDAYDVTWQTILIGTIAVVILSFIPILGWIANLLLLLAALGTFFKSGSDFILHRSLDNT